MPLDDSYVAVHLYKPRIDGHIAPRSVIVRLLRSNIIMKDLQELYDLVAPGTTMYVFEGLVDTDSGCAWIVTKPNAKCDYVCQLKCG